MFSRDGHKWHRPLRGGFIPRGPDADIRGWLRAELCDVFGRKIPGYHLMQAEPLTGNGHAHILRWAGRSTDGFRFDALRLRFEFQDGEIYSIGF